MNKNINDEISKIINAFNGARYDFVIDKTSILLKRYPKNDFLWNIKGLCLQIQKKYKNTAGARVGSPVPLGGQIDCPGSRVKKGGGKDP